MGRARFTCEYCNKSFEDSQDARRRHNSGRAHKANVKLWYDSFQDQAQRSAAGTPSAGNDGAASEWIVVAPSAPSTQAQAPAPPAATIDLQQLPPSMIPPPPELFLHYRTDWG